MAFIYCPGCDKQIEDTEVECPHCGHPVESKEEPEKKEKAEDRSTVALVLLIGGVLFALLSFMRIIEIGTGTPYGCIIGLVIAAIGLVLYMLRNILKSPK